MSATEARPGESERDENLRELPPEVLKARAGEEDLTVTEERGALEFLLGAPSPKVYTVPVDFDPGEGAMAKLKWVVKALDGRRIDAVEERNRNEATGRLDQITADCELVAEATLFFSDITGRRVKPTDDEFLTVQMRRPGEAPEEVRMASPSDAIEARFRTQLGLVSGVAREVRRISAWDAERVGKAQRALVEAAGN